MTIRNVKRDRLILLPFSVIAVVIMLLFQFWNPLPSLPSGLVQFYIKPAMLMIPWVALALVLINIFIKALKPWSWMTLGFIPLGYWYWMDQVVYCSGWMCNPSTNGEALGKVYLIITVLIIAWIYSRDWWQKRKLN